MTSGNLLSHTVSRPKRKGDTRYRRRGGAAVIGLIFGKPTEKLRTFDDAFRIRRDPTDG